VVLFVKPLVERSFLPRQRGALYTVRGENSDATKDHEIKRFLQEMIDLGLVDRVGRWKSWRELLRDPAELAQREDRSSRSRGGLS
jgi:hypothetical protein